MRPQSGVPLNRVQLRRLVLDLAKLRGRLTNSVVRERTGLKRHDARDLLGELVDDGLLELLGERRGAHYMLVEQAQSALDLESS